MRSPGRKPSFFAGFHGGAHEDDALDLVFFHRVGGGGHGEIGFAGAGRAEAEDDVVVQEGADVAVLARGAPADAAAFGVQIVLRRFGFLLMGRVGGFGFHGGEADVVFVDFAVLGEFGEGFEGAAAGVGVCAGEGEVGKAAARLDAEGFAQGGKVGIEGAG